jgi:hypothetical protein
MIVAPVQIYVHGGHWISREHDELVAGGSQHPILAIAGESHFDGGGLKSQHTGVHRSNEGNRRCELTAAERSARAISFQKEHHDVVWVDACFAKFVNQGGNKAFFPVGVRP